MSTKLTLVKDEPVDDKIGFSLNNDSAGVTVDEQSKNAMGGTEMMKHGLYDRLPTDLRDKVEIICSRVREVDKDRPSILWLHDLFTDPEAVHLRNKESRERFAKLVFVSNWQWTTYNLAMEIPYSEAIILHNAITPIESHKKPSDDTIRLIYHTTPHRGLEILVPVVDFLTKNGQDTIHLDVYSSFQAYGWPQRDEPYEKLFETIRNHPQMTYHGYQPNEVVREALKKADIFTYPSIWQETSCIAAIEAMSAACAVVHPNYGALPETMGNFGFSYQYHEDVQQHANIFANVLANVLNLYRNDRAKTHSRLQFQKMWCDNFYGWDMRSKEWEGLIRGILAEQKSKKKA